MLLSEMNTDPELRGILAVPLVQQNQLLGFIVLGEKRSGTLYTAEDRELLATVADQIAVAYENGRLHLALTEQERLKRELEIARQIQMHSLPQEDPSIPGFDIFGSSIPATEVGGDYYDYLTLPGEKLGIVLGDVSGKGTSAALYMSKIQGFFRALSPTCASPKELLCRVNRLAYENVEDKSFMTLVAAFVDPAKKRATVVRAGHTYILYYDGASRACSNWMPQGMGLALDRGDHFEKTLISETKTLNPGDVLLFFSDGLTEAMTASEEEFGEERLEHAFCELAGKDAKGVGEGILQAVRDFSEDTPQHDDMTLVVLKVN